jgi:hypothetical protein
MRTDCVPCAVREESEETVDDLRLRTMHDRLKNKNQLDATYYFIVLLIGSTCFGHYYAYHQELATIMLITTLVASFLVCCMLEVRCG